MMKKLFSLLLAVILVLGAVSALADMPKDAVPAYDDEGNLLGYYKSETDKKTGVVTTYRYDENGKLTQKQKDTSTQSDWEAYDEAGNSIGHGTY
jgi:YD repeat-containing protein